MPKYVNSPRTAGIGGFVAAQSLAAPYRCFFTSGLTYLSIDHRRKESVPAAEFRKAAVTRSRKNETFWSAEELLA
jgi:hypothetical protein